MQISQFWQFSPSLLFLFSLNFPVTGRFCNSCFHMIRTKNFCCCCSIMIFISFFLCSATSTTCLLFFSWLSIVYVKSFSQTTSLLFHIYVLLIFVVVSQGQSNNDCINYCNAFLCFKDLKKIFFLVYFLYVIKIWFCLAYYCSNFSCAFVICCCYCGNWIYTLGPLSSISYGDWTKVFLLVLLLFIASSLLLFSWVTLFISLSRLLSLCAVIMVSFIYAIFLILWPFPNHF